jgi:hypothetical protein
MSLKDDSMASITSFIAATNESVSQLGNMPDMSVSGIYALSTLMVLYLSPSAQHEKAYRDLVAYVDEGNALTLDQVLKT